MQLHFSALPSAEPAQALWIEKQNVLLIIVLQPDDEVRVITEVVEKGHASTARQIANQKQLFTLQAWVAVLDQTFQPLDNAPLVYIQGNGLDRNDAIFSDM